MKNQLFTLVLAAFCCCNLHAQAQVQKGMVLIGTSSNLLGNLNQLSSSPLSNNAGIQFGKTKTKYDFGSGNSVESEIKITAFNLSPSLGYMVSNNLMIGLSAGVFHYQIKDDDDDEYGFTALSITPNLRGYFKTEGKFLPFAELRGGIVSMKEKEEEEAESITLLGGKVGGAIFLSSKVSLDVFADYLYAWDKEELDSGSKIEQTQGLFGFGVGLSIFL